MKRFLIVGGLVVAALVAAMLAFQLGRAGESALPQSAVGSGDFLSMFLGDAREVLSNQAVHKADSYFHGGIDMECDESPADAHADEDKDEPCECGEEHHGGRHHASGVWWRTDPWRWINSHVRAPREHTHLTGESARELMPWFWVSVRMDPHNISAWTTAIYVAWSQIGDRELAMRVLDEGQKLNPKSTELAMVRGRMYYDLGRGDLKAAAAAMRIARELMLAEYGPDPSQYELERRRSFEYIENVIKKCEAVPQAQ